MSAGAEALPGVVLWSLAITGLGVWGVLLARRRAGRPLLPERPAGFGPAPPLRLLWAALLGFLVYQLLGLLVREEGPLLGTAGIAGALLLAAALQRVFLQGMLRPAGGLARRIGLGLLVFWAALPVVFGLLFALQLLGLEGQQSDVGWLLARRAGWQVLALFAVLAAPAAEEVVFRGLLYGALRRVRGPRFALVFTSALFGLVHAPPVVWAPLAVLGVFLGWLVEATGSLVPSVVAHLAFNGLMVGQMLLAPPA